MSLANLTQSGIKYFMTCETEQPKDPVPELHVVSFVLKTLAVFFYRQSD